MSECVCMYVFFQLIKLWPDQPLPPPPRIKNIKTLKQEIWNLKKLSAILFYGGEVDMSAQWDPTSNKDQHFFHCFSFWWRWAWFKDQKSKIASKFWYIYGSVTFFCLSVFSFFPLRPFCISVRVCTDRGALPSARFSIRLSVCLSIHPSIHPFIPVSGPAVSGACFLFLFPASCLSVGGAIVVSVSSTQGRQGQSFGYVHIHGRSMASNKQQHYFRRSSTHTWDRRGKGQSVEPIQQTITIKARDQEISI